MPAAPRRTAVDTTMTGVCVCAAFLVDLASSKHMRKCGCNQHNLRAFAGSHDGLICDTLARVASHPAVQEALAQHGIQLSLRVHTLDAQQQNASKARVLGQDAGTDACKQFIKQAAAQLLASALDPSKICFALVCIWLLTRQLSCWHPGTMSLPCTADVHVSQSACCT